MVMSRCEVVAISKRENEDHCHALDPLTLAPNARRWGASSLSHISSPLHPALNVRCPCPRPRSKREAVRVWVPNSFVPAFGLALSRGPLGPARSSDRARVQRLLNGSNACVQN
jgi:hypothetical protein